MFLIPADAWEVRGRAFSSGDFGKQNRGIFARKPIRAGTVIGDYLGLLIPNERQGEYEAGRDLYLMSYDRQLSIWPDPSRPGIHLVNHSCEPNCGLATYHGHGLYYALRLIHPGEELTVSYLLAPIDDECAPCLHACWCRTRSCTGSMHLPIDRYAAWRTFDERENRRGGTVTRDEPGVAFTQLRPLERYPARIGDRGFFGLFGSAEVPARVLPDDRLPSVAQIRREIRRTGRRLSFPKLGVTILSTVGATVTLDST